MFNCTGIIEYSPKTLGERTSDKWWIIVNFNSDLGAYIRKLYWLSTYKTCQLQRPAWKEHITVVRDEEPPNKQYWEKYHGNEIEIAVDFTSENNGDYFWLPVKSEQLLDIRVELGLNRDPFYPLHLSIGHLGN